MGASLEAVFIGANKQANSSDYNAELEVTAFGASSTVALWKPFSSQGVYSTLKAHSKEVTGVKFVPGSRFLVSCSEDGHVVVWSVNDDKRTFTEFQQLVLHEGSVTAVGTAPGIIATGGVDGKVAIWTLQEDKWTLKTSFVVKTGFYPTCLALENVYGEYLLAVGGTTKDVYIYSTEHELTGALVTLRGHEDWMKCLAWTKDESGYLLASGSQDRYIRLWRIRKEVPKSEEDANNLVLLANKKEVVKLSPSSSTTIEVFFEALIMGHDDWVTGLVWNSDQKHLLSCSADTGLMIWEMDTLSGIWVCVSRLGEMSIKGASTATGSSGGFWSCQWIQQGDSEYILANGKTGSYRVYERKQDETSWQTKLGITGPTKEVTDLIWSPNKKFFYTTSLDQTTRLFAFSKEMDSWREFARPQIHGYDMICIDNIDDTKFVSGGDEKILRVFEMTNNTAELLGANNVDVVKVHELPVIASLPVLGLSNKADNEATVKEGIVGEMNEEKDDDENDKEDESKADAAALDDDKIEVPMEDQLQRTTLFPEIEKLYGHGYELTCCTTTSGYIASACRSNSARHAVIRVFDTKDYQMCHVLEGHNLTITSMEFSPNGKYLVAVSRDRQLSLWDVDAGFKLIEIKQGHSRIIWDCCWLGNRHFVTGSRDKSIKLWKVADGGEQFELLATQKFESPVSSVASTPEGDGKKYYVAIGMENGIQIVSVDIEAGTLIESIKFDNTITPSGRISKLAWGDEIDSGKRVLSVGSNDSSVRVYNITI
ncbi:elongator complex protein 2 [[Candida] railenensis]|uniref:Elongator complex protein 2 n=1 Tax=[Candida] railenensis TaxID=45579 RepID=A0A9P0QU12_9ASCO|nr:elongator complex protein 2 [[Candida] railenensis]